METLSIVIMNWRDIQNPAAGGAELYIHELAKRWAKAGHRVTLLTSRFEGAATQSLLDGVEVHRQGSPYTVYRRVRQTYQESYRGKTDAVIDSVNTIPFLTPKYVDDGTRLFMLIFQLAREGWFYEAPLPVALVGRYVLENRWLRLYAGLPTFTLSESTRQDLANLGFGRVQVVRPGAPTSPKGVVPNKETVPTLLFVGRLKKYKLPHHAVAAFRIVHDRIPDAQLWIVGEGYMRKRLEREASAGVTLFGRVTNDHKVNLMQRAHVLLCPSIREGWGLVVTEANSLGLPAVGYDIPGLRDSIRNGVTGLLVPPKDIGALAEAAIGLVSNGPHLERMTEAAREWAHSLSWDSSADQMLKHITRTPRNGAPGHQPGSLLKGGPTLELEG